MQDLKEHHSTDQQQELGKSGTYAPNHRMRIGRYRYDERFGADHRVETTGRVHFRMEQEGSAGTTTIEINHPSHPPESP